MGVPPNGLRPDLPPGGESRLPPGATGWLLSIHRTAFPLSAPTRLRILEPVLAAGRPWLREAAAAAGCRVRRWGDRLAVEGDPEGLLAQEGRLDPGLARELRALLERRRPLRFSLPLPGNRTLALGDPPAIFG